MKVALLVPCFVDVFCPSAAIGMVTVLERLGHEVECPEAPACCGQPAFNAGGWDESRPVVEDALRTFSAYEAVVVGSGSCAAMLKVFSQELFAGDEERLAAVRDLAARTWEFSDFLVSRLGVEDVGARFPARVTVHDGCHGLRELGLKRPIRALLARVKDLELVEMAETETCCGFGGSFSVKFPMISTAMGEAKCEAARATNADYIVSNDASCLLHLGGLLARREARPGTLHLAEVLVRQ
jgi:L-lactate dehydrogenase complex protein LldE